MERQIEQEQKLPISEVHEFEEHPSVVRDDEYMQKTVESICSCGITTPLPVRPDTDGRFEIISGLRRHCAAGCAGQQIRYPHGNFSLWPQRGAEQSVPPFPATIQLQSSMKTGL